uniref:Uncharacterized protein n=1 Tax=Solanum lycopersicum TaxID=4081 RepID=A0A3Q7HTV1_SOLLC
MYIYGSICTITQALLAPLLRFSFSSTSDIFERRDVPVEKNDPARRLKNPISLIRLVAIREF